jgi:hypothetical protein
MTASTISNVGYTTWLCLNMAMSHHMLQEPLKNYLRLTVLSQHAVTAFSALRLARTLGWADSCDDLDAFLQTHLAFLLAKISLLFTGMIILFLWYGRRKQKKTAINSKPMTTWRVLRNLYCHYGTTAVLWWLNKPHIPDGLRASTNGVLVFWFCCIARHFGIIYDVEGVSSTEITLAFAALLLVSDGFNSTIAACLPTCE